jgi:hypothetical protein
MRLFLTACLCVAVAMGLRTVSNPQEPLTGATVAGLPTDTGLYYKDASKWTKLEKAVPTDSGNKGAFKAALLGFGSAKYFDLYDSGQSSVQISEPRPNFYVRIPADVDKQVVTVATKTYGMNPNDVGFVFFGARADIRDIKIIQLKLDKKKNLRGIEFKIIAGKRRYAENAVHQVAVKRVNDGVILITPNSDLVPGEYLLLISDALAWNFDFSVVAK